MSFLQSFRLRSLPGLLLVFSLVVSAKTIRADSPIANELGHIRTANTAMEELATARLELERFNLRRIQQLTEQGHASWLELRRQQVLVDSLVKQRESLKKFQQFVEQVENQVHPNGHYAENRNPVRIYLPGSVRLVGWIEPHDTAEDFHSFQSAPATENATLDEQRIAKAEKRLEKAIIRCQDFDSATTAPAHWSQRAELQRNLAQAELNLLKAQSQFDPQAKAVTSVASEFPVAWQADLLRAPVTASDQTGLLQASYRVAVAEANVTGSLTVAKVEMRRQQQKTLAIEKLHADGHATKRELQKHRQLLKGASQLLQQERDRIAFLKDICSVMNDSIGFDAIELEANTNVEVKTNCTWPNTVLGDAARIRHLVDLRRRCFDLEAERAANNVKLEMQMQVLEKLKAAQTRNATSATPEQSNTSLTDFHSLLIAGEQKQIASVELKIEALQARIQDVGEQITILSLEEERFVLQCELQVRGNESMFVGTVSTSTRRQSRRPRSYLEFDKIDEKYGYLNATCDWDPAYFSFSFDRRTTSPLIHSHRYPLSLSPMTPSRFRPAWCRSGYDSLSTSRLTRFSSDLDYGNRSYRESRSCESRYRFGSWSYQSIYPFGMLRADLRSCLPPGYAPWYFPGYPTNLQPTNLLR